MWPFKRKKQLAPLFAGLSGMIVACKRKNRDLYEELKRLSPGSFWRQWKRVYPEDFPQGGMTLPSPDAIVE